MNVNDSVSIATEDTATVISYIPPTTNANVERNRLLKASAGLAREQRMPELRVGIIAQEGLLRVAVRRYEGDMEPLHKGLKGVISRRTDGFIEAWSLNAANYGDEPDTSAQAFMGAIKAIAPDLGSVLLPDVMVPLNLRQGLFHPTHETVPKTFMK